MEKYFNIFPNKLLTTIFLYGRIAVADKEKGEVMKTTKWDSVVKAKWFTCPLPKFTKKGYTWQEAYFELLQWKNTWSVCERLDMRSNKDYPFVEVMIMESPMSDFDVTCRKVYDYLTELGYGTDTCEGNVKVLAIEEVDDSIYEYVVED